MSDYQFDLSKFLVVPSTKYGGGYARDPKNIEINGKSVSIGLEAMSHAGLQTTQKQIQVAYRYHPGPPAAIAILPPEKADDPSGLYVLNRAVSGHRYNATIPYGFKELKMPRGRYTPVEGQPGIFVCASLLAKEEDYEARIKADYYEEDPAKIQKGDVVSWQFGSSGKLRWGTGIVRRLAMKDERPKVVIHPISKTAVEHIKTLATVDADKVILRRKHNG